MPAREIKAIHLEIEYEDATSQSEVFTVTPERNLLSAVLSLALSDVLSGGEEAEAALEWLTSDEIEMGSFRWLAAHLGREPEEIIGRALRALRRQPAKSKDTRANRIGEALKE